MSKGRHERNWVWIDTGYQHDGRVEVEIIHEEKSEGHGVFGVVAPFYTGESWYVIWRPNRNYTTDWKIVVMSEKQESKYSWREGQMEDVSVQYDSLGKAIESLSYWQKTFERPEKPKLYRPRDSQKSKMYRWEHRMVEQIGPREITSEGREVSTCERKREHMYLHMYLNEVCNQLGEEKPDLKFRSGGRSSYGGIEIRLLPNHCTITVLLHELAHVLHRRWGRETPNGVIHQAHGKEFVGIYAYLLIRFVGIDKHELLGHAVKSKIKILLPEQYWEWIRTNTERKVA